MYKITRENIALFSPFKVNCLAGGTRRYCVKKHLDLGGNYKTKKYTDRDSEVAVSGYKSDFYLHRA